MARVGASRIGFDTHRIGGGSRWRENPTRICDLIFGFGAGGVGGSADVRAPSAPHVAQVALVVPGRELCGGVVHRGR